MRGFSTTDADKNDDDDNDDNDDNDDDDDEECSSGDCCKLRLLTRAIQKTPTRLLKQVGQWRGRRERERERERE